MRCTAEHVVLSVGNGGGFHADPNSRNSADAPTFMYPPTRRVRHQRVEPSLGSRRSSYEHFRGARVRGRDFNRADRQAVAEVHRILMRGGVPSPRDTREPERPGRLRLLYEANPIGFIMEQAGGRASTGRQPMLGVRPSALHQRIGLVFGSRHEVERIERYHHETLAPEGGTPLFAERTLFRN